MPLGNSFSITVVWGISVMLHRGIRQSGIDCHSAKADDHLSYAFGLRRSHLALKWKSRQRRSNFVGEHCQVHYMSISSHWKHKKSIHIDCIASNGGVATFFPGEYVTTILNTVSKDIQQEQYFFWVIWWSHCAVNVESWQVRSHAAGRVSFGPWWGTSQNRVAMRVAVRIDYFEETHLQSNSVW